MRFSEKIYKAFRDGDFRGGRVYETHRAYLEIENKRGKATAEFPKEMPLGRALFHCKVRYTRVVIPGLEGGYGKVSLEILDGPLCGEKIAVEV